MICYRIQKRKNTQQRITTVLLQYTYVQVISTYWYLKRKNFNYSNRALSTWKCTRFEFSPKRELTEKGTGLVNHVGGALCDDHGSWEGLNSDLASRKRDLSIMTASHVFCLSCSSMAENFFLMMRIMWSISRWEIGRVRLCSRKRFTTWFVNSPHACKHARTYTSIHDDR